MIVCPWHLHRDPRFWRALILATLARRFRPRPAPGAPPRPEFGFTLRPAGCMRIMLERR